MKPNLHLIVKHPCYFSAISHRTRRRIHTGPPVLPCGLCIDRDTPLANTVPPYTQHVVISTGRDDWASRIETEKEPNLAKALRKLVGPNGEFHHVRLHLQSPQKIALWLRLVSVLGVIADHVTKVARS